jgi:MSHA pilin protein MshD
MRYKHPVNSKAEENLNFAPIWPKAHHFVQTGFTLIETIIGIVVLSIAFSILTALIYPLAEQSAEQVHQVRASELGQSMLNEILAKAFDENSDKSGGRVRCGETNPPISGLACSNTLGPELNETRVNFDDVDDYHLLNTIETALGSSDSLATLYVGFKVEVRVINDSNYDAINNANDNNFTAKLITITVTTPQNFNFVFSAYRANY